ncbi:MAG TPA: hypothetical protein VHB98_07340, partial [Chloroflexota bacterium]|nr:hypothetical protein [Chloroflexota bacterium]
YLLAPYVDEHEEPNPDAPMVYWMIGGVYDGVLTGGLGSLHPLHPSYRRSSRRLKQRRAATVEWI